MARQIVVDIVGDSKGYTGATNEAIRATATLETRLDGAKKALLAGFGAGVGFSAVSIASRGLTMVTDYLKNATDAASDQAEAQSKVSVVFGEQSRVIQQWASTAARSMGLSKTAALDAAGSLGNLFDGMGLTEQATTSMSKSIVQLAADLGSFNNVSTDDALTALKAGLVGETEPLRRFGVALNATAVEAEAARLGLVEMVSVGGKLKPYISDAAKVQARYSLILKGTVNAQGDFARTADGMANSQKSLDAALEDLSAEVGRFLVGPAADLVKFFTTLVTGSRTSGGAIQEFLNEQRRLRGEVTAGKDPLDVLTKGLAALVSQTDDTKVITAEAAREFGWLGRMAGQTGQDIMDLWKFYREGGASIEETTRLVKAFLQSVVLTGETTSVTTPLLSAGWSESLGIVREQVVRTGGVLSGLTMVTKETIESSLRTMDDAKDPWRTAWRAFARYAKDPFTPENFENYIDRFARRAARKGAEAAEEGRGPAARAWRRLANAAKDPVVRAMAAITGDVLGAIATITTLKTISSGLGDLLPNILTVFGRDPSSGGINVGRNARGTSYWRGGPTWVGEEGPEIIDLPTGTAIHSNQQSMAMAGGGTTNVYNVTVNVPPTANLADVGREITRALKAFGQGGGQASMRAAIGVRG